MSQTQTNPKVCWQLKTWQKNSKSWMKKYITKWKESQEWMNTNRKTSTNVKDCKEYEKL